MTLGQPRGKIQREWIAVATSLDHVIKIFVIVYRMSCVNYLKLLVHHGLSDLDRCIFEALDLQTYHPNIVDVVLGEQMDVAVERLTCDERVVLE